MPGSNKTINQFIADIYSAVVDADKWTDILDNTARIAGAKAANICLIDYVAEELNSQFMCPETARFYPVYMQSPHMAMELKAVARLPQIQTTAKFYETNEFVQKANENFPDDPIDLCESEDWLYHEWSVRNRYISRLNIQPSYLDIHTILFDKIPEAERLQGIEKIELLTPHFAKAVEISRPFLLLKSRFQATLDVLDRFHLGVFVLSPDGSVVLNNAAADRILDLADAIALDAHGKIASTNANGSPGIDKVIDKILMQQRNGDIRHSTEIVLQRRSQRSPYLAEITPLSEPSVIGQITGLMVIIIDPDHKKIVSTKGMKAIFGLSNAENHIVQLLTEGHSTQEIADIRNVSPVTVKNQIKSLLSKTGNRNRSDLIRQALSINLPIDQSNKTD